VFSPIPTLAIAAVAAFMGVGVVFIARCPSRPPVG
jgi:hypothetical protein